jgi:hypothetical protein
MYRRLRQGKSPFKPDRGHIHHILLDAGLGPRRALVALVALACSFAFLGSVTHSMGAGSGSNLIAFCIVSGVYVTAVTRIRVRQELRKKHSIPPSLPSAGAANVLSITSKLTHPVNGLRDSATHTRAYEAANSSD